MVRLVAIQNISEEEARAIMREQLPELMNKLRLKAYRAWTRTHKAYAEHTFTGSLLDAAVRLPEEFERQVRTCLSTPWVVDFGYTVINNAPGTVMIRRRR